MDKIIFYTTYAIEYTYSKCVLSATQDTSNVENDVKTS